GSGGGGEDLDLDVAGEPGERGRGRIAQRRLAGRRKDDRVDEIGELVAGGYAVEAEPVITGALDDDGRHLGDAVRLGPLAIDGEVEDLDRDQLGRRGDLTHQRFVTGAQLGGRERLGEDHELDGIAQGLKQIADLADVFRG